MAAISGQFVPYNRLGESLVDFFDSFSWTKSSLGQTGSSVAVSLHTSTYHPNQSHAFGSDVNGELPATGHYERKPLRGRDLVFDEAVARYQFKASRVTWSLATFAARWAVLRFTSESDGPNLIGWVDFGVTVIMSNAQFEITWDNGTVFEMTATGDIEDVGA